MRYQKELSDNLKRPLYIDDLPGSFHWYRMPGANSEYKYGVKIFTVGASELQERCQEVTVDQIANDPELRNEVSVGHEALKNFRQIEGFGRALAAPQVGFLRRFIVMNINNNPITLYNPVITGQSTGNMMTMWDDCLSFPDLMVCVERYRHISVEYIDSNGEKVEWKNLPSDLSELLQHEIDHLNGVLALDIAIAPYKNNEKTNAARELGIVKRADWLVDKDRFNSMVDFHY